MHRVFVDLRRFTFICCFAGLFTGGRNDTERVGTGVCICRRSFVRSLAIHSPIGSTSQISLMVVKTHAAQQQAKHFPLVKAFASEHGGGTCSLLLDVNASREITDFVHMYRST